MALISTNILHLEKRFPLTIARGTLTHSDVLWLRWSEEGVEGWGGIWMRVDDVDKPGTSFDNMQNRPAKGTADWTPYAIVLDVSDNAAGIYFGTLTSGKGQLWITDLRFEVVGTDVPVTSPKMTDSPGNLTLTR
jgi:hypothetical protein